MAKSHCNLREYSHYQ